MDAGIYSALEKHDNEDLAILKTAPDSIQHEFEGRVDQKPLFNGADSLLCTEAAPFTRVVDRFSIRKHTAPIRPYFHRHRFAELIYVHKGICRQWIDSLSNPQDIPEGHFDLIGPGVKHALQPPGPGDLILKFFIPTGFLSGIFNHPSDPLAQVFGSPVTASSLWLRFTPQEIDRTGVLLEALLKEALLVNHYRTPACKSYLVLLLIELMRSGRPQSTYNSLDSAQHIDRVISSLCTADTYPTLEELACRLGYHPGYLGRRIREEYRCGYRQLIQRLRLERAVEMLLGTGDTVEAVSQRLGYDSPNSLYRLIRAAYGISPAELRKRGSVLTGK